jgi:hypothetical protein
LSYAEAEEKGTAQFRSSTARSAVATLNESRRAGSVIAILVFILIVFFVVVFISDRSELEWLNTDDFEIGRALRAGDDFSFV